MTGIGDRNDGQLLAAFAEEGDDAAFAALVERHGKMVQSACMRVLGEFHEAQDVTQAVFLTLARKAAQLRKDSSVGGWLHRVATCLARDVLSANRSRKQREEKSVQATEPVTSAVEDIRALREKLDYAVEQLPARYRQPLVLFHLEERSLDATALALGLKASAASARLVRAREMLRAKLVRRGVTVGSASTLTTLFSAEAGAAVLPATIVSATVKAAGLAAAGKLAAGVGTGVVSANVAALTKGACNMLFWSSVKTAAVAVAASVAVVGGGAIMAQQVAQREAADSDEVILRAAEIPISAKDAKGEIYVAVGKHHFDRADRQLWSFGTGMTDCYRRILRLTEKEQTELQVLLEETWAGSDVLERCFVVKAEGESVTAELPNADAVHLLQDVELRLRTNFLQKAAGILGPGRAEVMEWFTAQHRGIVPWPLGGRPQWDATRYRMKLSRVPGVSSGGIRFEIEKEGPPAGGAGGYAATSRLECVSSVTPWPALGERLGFARATVLEQKRADRTRYAQRQREGIDRDAPYRQADAPLAPPPIGAEDTRGYLRAVYVAMDVAARDSLLNWMAEPQAAGGSGTASDRYAVNQLWQWTLVLSESQSLLLAGVFQRTVNSMNLACASGLEVTSKSADKVSCVVRAEAPTKFAEILERQHREVQAALDSEEKADVVRAFTAAAVPVSGYAAELLWWGLRDAGKDGARFELETKKQASDGDAYAVRRLAPDGSMISERLVARNELPPFLAALLPAAEPARDPGATPKGN